MFDRYDLFEEMKEEREMAEDAAEFIKTGLEYIRRAKEFAVESEHLAPPDEPQKVAYGEDAYYSAICFRDEAKQYFMKRKSLEKS